MFENRVGERDLVAHLPWARVISVTTRDGRWNAETFIVEAIGINDRTWLDDSGYLHSDALKITERMRRVDFGRLEIEFTFDDPKTYTRPWSANVPLELVPDTELLGYVCENERDLALVGGK